MITDRAHAALSAPQRAVLALQAAWAGKRPDPALLIMPRDQQPTFDRLYRDAVSANVHLGRLIRTLHLQAQQEQLAVATWEIEEFHAAALDEARWSLGPIEDRRVSAVVEGGRPLACPRSLDDLDDTPSGRRAQLLKGSRDRLMGIANRAYATAEILEVIQGELGADPLHSDLRRLLEETHEVVDDALFDTIGWAGPVRFHTNTAVVAEVRQMWEAGR